MIELNGNKIIPTIFPDKTSQVWKLQEYFFEGYESNITWKFEHEGEFIHLAQLIHLIQYKKRGPLYIVLHLPYLPYGRQDKYISNEETFALITFILLLGNIGIQKIIVNDPHSTDILFTFRGKIEAIEIIYPISEVQETFKKVCADYIAYPDHGALEKYKNIYKDIPYIHAKKERNQETGEILELEIEGEQCIKDKNILIVDDICDGGCTFIRLAEKLYKKGAKNVHLFVSHGLFTKGLECLHEAGIKRIFTPEGEQDVKL